MAITLLRSNYDEFNPSNNGGGDAGIIESGVIESFIKNVRPFLAEQGGKRYFKFFIKSSVDIIDVGICVTPSLSEKEEVYLFLSDAEFESDIDKDNIRLYGGFIVESVDGANNKITADRDVGEFVKAGDLVSFFDSEMNRKTALKVSGVDGGVIEFETMGDVGINAGYFGSSSIYFETINANELKAVWIKEVIEPFCEVMEDPLNKFNLNVWYDVK